MIFKQETIQSWFSGVGSSINNEVIQPFQNAEQVIWKYNQAIQHNSLTQQGWERLLAQSDDSLKAYLTSIKGIASTMTGYNVSLQGNITGFKKVSSAITQYNALSASGAKEQNIFANAVSVTNGKLGTYLTGLNGAKASIGGYVVSLVGATVKTVALKVATIALNSAITMGASLIISGIASAVSEWIHKTENMISASEDAIEKIKSINDELKNNQKTISDTAKRYAELAQGVNQLTGENISLSNEDYEEFLTLSNQLSEMFPTLTRNYNDNGDAIIQLSGDVDTIVGSLQNLIESQRDLANRQIVDELPTVFDGIAAKSDQYEQQLSDLESRRDALVKSLGNVQSEEFSSNFMDGFSNKWIEISGDNLEVISQMRADYLKILKEANIDFEELTPTYEIKDGVEVPVGFTIKINSSDENVENAKNTIDGKIQELASQYETDIAKLNDEINTTNRKNKANWTSLSSSIFAWLSTDDSFKVMNDTMQATVQNVVNSLDWGSLDFSSWEDAKQYIQENILSLFNTSEGKETLADIEVMFGIQTQFNNGNITVEQYQQKLQDFLDSIKELPPETKKSILLLFGIQTNDDGTTTSDVDTMVENVKKKLKGTEFDDKVGELSLGDLKIAADLEVGDDTIQSWDDLIERIEKVKSETFNNKTDDLSFKETVAEMDKLKDGFSALDSAYAKFIDKDKKIGFEDISALTKQFKGVKGASKYIKQIQEANGDVKKTQEAFNGLTTVLLEHSGILDKVTDKNKDLVISMLEDMGVANAETIVTDQLAAKKLLTKTETEEFKNATWEEIEAMAQEQGASDSVIAKLAKLKLQKLAVNGAKINTSDDIDNIIAIANAANVSSKSLARLMSIKKIMHLAESIGDDKLLDIVKEIANDSLNDIDYKEIDSNDFKYTSGTDPQDTSENNKKDSKEKEKKKDQEEEFDNIERRLQKISNKISEIQDKISDRNAYAKNMKYLNQLTNYIEKNLAEYEKSYKRYMKMANSIKLPESYKTMIRNGDLDITGSSAGSSSNSTSDSTSASSAGSGVVKWAQSQLGKSGFPYDNEEGWSPSKSRCESFAEMAYRANGLDVPRMPGAIDAQTAWMESSDKNPPIGAALFYKSKSKYGHVGIYIGNGKSIEAGNAKIITNDAFRSNYIGWGYMGGSKNASAIQGMQTTPSNKKTASSVKIKKSDGTVKKINTDSELYGNLKAYQKWYEKAQDVKTSISEIYKKYVDAFRQKFDLTKEKYDNKIAKIKKGVEVKESKGKTASASDYAKIAENSLKKRIDLTKQLNKMVDAGIIDKYSTTWYNMKDAINEATVSLNEYIEKLKNHSLAQEKYNAVKDELDAAGEYRGTFGYSPTSKSRRQEYNKAIHQVRADAKAAQEELNTKQTYKKTVSNLKKQLKSSEIKKKTYNARKKIAKLEYESNKDIVKNAKRAEALLQNEKLDTKRKKIEIRINRKNRQVDDMADRLIALDEAKGNYTNADYLKSKIESSQYRLGQHSNDLAIVQEKMANFVGSHNSEQYQEYIEEERTILDAIKDEEIAQKALNDQIKQIPLDMLSDQLDLLEAINGKMSSANELQQAMGKDLSESDYYALMANNEEQIKNLQSQITLAWMQFSGGTQDIVTTQSKVAGLEAQINNLKKSNIELKNTMRDDVYWRDFVRAHTTVKNLQTILEGMTGFIDDDMIFVDGQITDFGISKLAVLSKEYANAKDDVVNYMDDLENLEKLYAQGWYTEKDYKEKLQELKEGLLDATQSVKGFSDSVTDMHQKLLQNELDELKEMSESYIEALQKKKDYYDYDKTLRNANKNIQSLKAERAALEGVATAEAKAKKARLDAQIKEAEDELNDTKYEHYITLVTDGLNDTADKLQEKLDDYFEHLATDFNEIANIMLKAAELYESSADTIADSYNKLLDSLGVDTEKYNWNNLTGFAGGGRIEKAAAKTGDTAITSIKVGEEVVAPEIIKLAEDELPIFKSLAYNAMLNDLVKVPKLPTFTPVNREPIVINYENSVNVQGDLVRDTLPDLQTILKKSSEYTKKDIVQIAGNNGWKRTYGTK